MEQERSAGRSIRDTEKTVLQELVPYVARPNSSSAGLCVGHRLRGTGEVRSKERERHGNHGWKSWVQSQTLILAATDFFGFTKRLA
jgi:hypothetical protein